jgi:hypothetical protein
MVVVIRHCPLPVYIPFVFGLWSTAVAPECPSAVAKATAYVFSEQAMKAKVCWNWAWNKATVKNTTDLRQVGRLLQTTAEVNNKVYEHKRTRLKKNPEVSSAVILFHLFLSTG